MNSINWLKLIPSGFFSEQLLWRAFHLFIFSVAVFLVVFSWMSWLHQEFRPSVKAEAAVMEPEEKKRTAPDSRENQLSLGEYRQSIAQDIFGDIQKNGENDSTDVSLEDIPLSEKDLHLKLVGTILRDEPEESIAVIEDTRSGDQKMYSVGDKINQIQIESILRSNVVISSSDGKKVLTMQYKTLRESKRGRRNRNNVTNEERTGYATQNISKDYVLQSLKNMSNLMQSALIKPYQNDGKTVGFQLDNIQSGSFYDKIGLRDNDVLLSIDDTDLKNPQQLMEFSQKLRTKDQIRLTLRRNGQKQQIRYRLR